MTEEKLLQKLNAASSTERLEALRELVERREAAERPPALRGRDVNNHIHTTYSFSPYSPTKAVWMAAEAGLVTAGIMDHDSISGAREFIAAGEMLGLPTTIGAECRVSFAGTSLEDRRINNPDQAGIAYVTLHGVPHNRIDALAAFLEPVRHARAVRNRKMTARLNDLLQPADISLTYDTDVVPLSEWTDGGAITERHLLFAVALQLLARFGSDASLVAFLRETLMIAVSEQAAEQLVDANNTHAAFDLVGVLKSGFMEQFYLPATDECLLVREMVKFTRENGIVLAYAYLGDVTQSVTGDKKAQNFEDAYLDELFAVLQRNGISAITYMPSRNTHDQLVRLRALCDRYGFFQISGEDINQPRQKFVCEAMRDPFFSNLYDAAWALIGHERQATESVEAGMFSPETIANMPLLGRRIAHYRDIAFKLYNI